MSFKLDLLDFAVVRYRSRSQVSVNDLSGCHPVTSEQTAKLTFTHFTLVVGLDGEEHIPVRELIVRHRMLLEVEQCLCPSHLKPRLLEVIANSFRNQPQPLESQRHRFHRGVVEMAQTTQDSRSLLLGAGKDAGVYYDGTDLVVDPKLVGSGKLRIKNSTYVEGDSAYGISLYIANSSGHTWRFDSYGDNSLRITDATAGGSRMAIHENGYTSFGAGVSGMTASDLLRL